MLASEIIINKTIYNKERGPKSYRTVGTAKHPIYNKQSPRLT